MQDSKLISLKIDVMKIDKSKLFHAQSGAKYIDLDVWISATPDKYGNDASASIRQTEEEREAKAKRTYVGNGQKRFGWGDSQQPAELQEGAAGSAPEEDDDIPF